MTFQGLNAIDATRKPRESLIRYLLTAYPLSDPHLRHGFQKLLQEPGAIAQDPYVEGMQPYKPGASLSQLVGAGILHQDILRMFDPDRPLYSHQEAAIQAAVNGENVVVATGTGSGKTECFAIPMLDALLKNPSPGAGVQALILYPMNALVNDQVKRLRILLSKQQRSGNKIRFGFYTSRTQTKPEDAKKILRDELLATDRPELLALFDKSDISKLRAKPHHELVDAALGRILEIQAISRQEIWENPPQILVTNYSMLEHMLVRPTERTAIFERSTSFRLLVLDEAHTYNGSTGAEVAMLLRRFKSAVGIAEKGVMQGIATSASLGDLFSPSSRTSILRFANQLFGEDFSTVIGGERITADSRLGKRYAMLPGVATSQVYEYIEALNLPSSSATVDEWYSEISALIPHSILNEARDKSSGNTHQFLWYALKGNPLIHNLISSLEGGPQPWHKLATSSSLWDVPTNFEGEIPKEEQDRLEGALSNLIQLGSMARLSEDELPLVPVRLHLLFRTIEGLFACINPECSDRSQAPDCATPFHYGRMYLTSKHACECCGAPVIEIASCRKCGTDYGIIFAPTKQVQSVPRFDEDPETNQSVKVLSTVAIEKISNDEDTGDEEDPSDEASPHSLTLNGSYTLKPAFISKQNNSWHYSLGTCILNQPDTWPINQLAREKENDSDGSQVRCCPACGAKRRSFSPLSRFISFTDAPLEVLLDSIFELLPDITGADQASGGRRKILTFSDSRQDAAFFASDFQRTHTELLYRQIVWKAFCEQADNNTASVLSVESKIVESFLALSIPHPDRDASWHHISYVPEDSNEQNDKNQADCLQKAKSRAKEILLREFALPSARRFSVESLGLIACHIPSYKSSTIQGVIDIFKIQPPDTELVAKIFLTVLTDQIRLLGAVDLTGSSNYFPETGGSAGPGIKIPSSLDGQNRPKACLKLSKGPKEKNVIRFLPRMVGTSNRVHAQQNRIISYITKFFGESCNKETLLKLYDLLVAERLLVELADAKQLNWNLFNLFQSDTGWFQCPCCRQNFHIPHLNDLTIEHNPAYFSCPSYQCKGTLSPVDIKANSFDHYQELIRRPPLPLRAEEHTAQIDPDELSVRENRFRQGKTNLLSASTTLEMGVDIGELQVVALRNFPPFVSNYQQRAGRAGRRTDGVAVTLMYGQRRPHDRYYFDNPSRLIDGANQVPTFDANNFSIQRRHIHAELISLFLHEYTAKGAEKITMGEFLGLSEDSVEESTLPDHSLAIRFSKWLRDDEALTRIQYWLQDLESTESPNAFLDYFSALIDNFCSAQQKDWNGHIQNYAEVMDKSDELRKKTDPESKKLKRQYGRVLDAIEIQVSKIRSRTLHEEFAKSSITPIYGFPIDVVQLYTRSNTESFNRAHNVSKHKLQRDRRKALSEYAPGQEIIVADRLHRSVAVYRPNDLERRFYWVCQACNFFISASTDDPIEQRLRDDPSQPEPCCPVCKSVIKRKKSRDSKSSNSRFSKAYKIPRAFTTDWSKEPEVTPTRKPKRQFTSQVFLANADQDAAPTKTRFFQTIASTAGEFFLSNQGPSSRAKAFANPGYPLCMNCGLDLTHLLPRRKSGLSTAIPHVNPYTQASCQGRYQNIHLAHTFTSDLVKIRFTEAASPPPLYGDVVNVQSEDGVFSEGDSEHTEQLGGLTFWRSLTYAVLAGASQVVDVDRDELDGLFRPLAEEEGVTELVIYDNVPSGAGHSKRIAERFQEVLERTLSLVSSCTCASSCYDCLRTYSNQTFHDELDRHQVISFLQPLVEQLAPDDRQINFAPSSIYIDLTRVDSLLTRASRWARNQSFFSLQQINDTFSIGNLVRAIDENRVTGIPFKLLLSSLPQSSANHSNAVLRKRLHQWIDQGVLELYIYDGIQHDEFCFSSSYPSRCAYRLFRDDSGEVSHCLETRSDQGVAAVLERLSSIQQKARLVSLDELADPTTNVVLPERSSVNYTLETLRRYLGFADLLGKSKLLAADYSDRYFDFNNRGHSKLLADLLTGPWLSKKAKFTLRTSEQKDEAYTGDGDRRRQHIRDVFAGYDEYFAFSLDWRSWASGVNPANRLDHQRVMLLAFEDGTSVRVFLDKGLDFISEPTHRGFYLIRDNSYLVYAPESLISKP